MMHSKGKCKFDARKLDHKTLTELRIRAVAKVQSGGSPEIVARLFGISRATIYGWLALYRSGGWGALDAKKRGGRPPKLDAKKIKWVYETVTMKNPMQLQLPFALWTTEMIAKIIYDKFKIRLSRFSVARLLRQLGLSPQRPLWRAYQQNPEAVKRWLKEEYPMIEKRAIEEDAEIYFADEAGVRSDSHSGTTWGIVGETPVVSSTGARFGMNLISAVNRRGKMRFMVVDGCVGAKVFISFLSRLTHDIDRKIFLIVDGHPAHKAKMVKEFIADNIERIELFLLPAYSPELNPDEQVWNNLKNHCMGRRHISSREQFEKDIISHMRHIQHSPELIRAFFRTPTTKYASGM